MSASLPELLALQAAHRDSSVAAGAHIVPPRQLDMAPIHFTGLLPRAPQQQQPQSSTSTALVSFPQENSNFDEMDFSSMWGEDLNAAEFHSGFVHPSQSWDSNTAASIQSWNSTPQYWIPDSAQTIQASTPGVLQGLGASRESDTYPAGYKTADYSVPLFAVEPQPVASSSSTVFVPESGLPPIPQKKSRLQRTCRRCGNKECQGARRIDYCHNPCRDCKQLDCEGRNPQYPGVQCNRMMIVDS